VTDEGNHSFKVKVQNNNHPTNLNKIHSNIIPTYQPNSNSILAFKANKINHDHLNNQNSNKFRVNQLTNQLALRIKHNKDYSSTQLTANRNVNNRINNFPSYSSGLNNTNTNSYGKDYDKDDVGDFPQGNKNSNNINHGDKKEEAKNVNNQLDSLVNKIISTSNNNNQTAKKKDDPNDFDPSEIQIKKK